MGRKPTYEELEKEVFYHKQTEQEVEDEQERMETILSALNTGLALINRDMTVAWVNAETEKILPWDELVGKVCYEAAAKREEPCDHD